MKGERKGPRLALFTYPINEAIGHWPECSPTLVKNLFVSLPNHEPLQSLCHQRGVILNAQLINIQVAASPHLEKKIPATYCLLLRQQRSGQNYGIAVISHPPRE